MKNIAIFASGSGSNAENIYKFFANGNRVRVPLLLYDRVDAGVRERMAKYPDVKTLYIPASEWREHPENILTLLRQEGIDMVVLAGFLRMVPEVLTMAYAGRMLNIHPSLLPAYGGAGMYGDRVHKAVIDAGESRSGATVHFVTNEIDGGEILMQETVEIDPADTPESLAQKIHEVEYSLYPRAIVAALARIEKEEAGNPPSIEGVTPPPMPTPAEEWAETLGVAYNPDKIGGHPNPEMANSDTQASGVAGGYGAEQYGATQYGAAQYGGAQYGPGQSPKADPRNAPGIAGEKMPPTNLVWAILTTILCCLPLGVVAIIYASQVTNKYYAGDMEGARKASRNAEIWIIISFVVGVMANTLYMPLMMLF